MPDWIDLHTKQFEKIEESLMDWLVPPLLHVVAVMLNVSFVIAGASPLGCESQVTCPFRRDLCKFKVWVSTWPLNFNKIHKNVHFELTGIELV